MIYYAKIDENYYITDLTCLTPPPENYVSINIQTMPDDIIYGYYKWQDGLVLDQEKKDIVMTELENAMLNTAL
jgi:hypothetical protein